MGSAFEDYNDVYNSRYKESIRQLYYNGIMSGSREANGKVYYYPKKYISRCEICKSIMSCLFDLDENIKNVKLTLGGYNSQLEFDVDLSKPSGGWNDEYYIYAPRSGYYFIKVTGNNLGESNYKLYERTNNYDNTYTYAEITDDHTMIYGDDGLPSYITSQMYGDGYIYKRYYIDKNTGLRLSNISSNVETITIQSPQNGDIVFKPNGGGKYIFSNSPETITEDYVADGNGKRYWIMNNYGLTAGDYSMTMYHHTNQLTDAVYIDAKFYAEQDTTIVFNRFGYGKPVDEWASLNIYADYIGNNILAPYNTSKNPYNETTYRHKNQYYIGESITIPAETCIWLSDIHNMVYHGVSNGGRAGDYPQIGGYAKKADGSYVLDENGNKVIDGTPIFGMMDFEILSGFLDIDILAYRNRDSINAEARVESPYIFENHHKGVADSLPGADTELYFEINDNLEFDEYDTAYLKGRIFSEKNPLGTDAYTWVSHINPQSDMYTDNSAVENDMFALKYADPKKLNFYADDVPQSERDDIWRFDTIHTQVRTPYLKAYSNPRDPSIRIISETFADANNDGVPDDVPSKFKPNDFIKNMAEYQNDTFIKDDGIDDYKLLAASLGNYGVVEKYTISVTNSSSETRYLNYKITEDSNIVINRNGNYVLHNSGSRDKDNVSKPNDDIGVEYYLAELPPGKTTTVEFSITLPTADAGGIQNSLVIKKSKMGIDEKGEVIQ